MLEGICDLILATVSAKGRGFAVISHGEGRRVARAVEEESTREEDGALRPERKAQGKKTGRVRVSTLRLIP